LRERLLGEAEGSGGVEIGLESSFEWPLRLDWLVAEDEGGRKEGGTGKDSSKRGTV
jgi:hypothetical protein